MRGSYIILLSPSGHLKGFPVTSLLFTEEVYSVKLNNSNMFRVCQVCIAVILLRGVHPKLFI